MTEIKYHPPRLPDEEEVTEVHFTSHTGNSRSATHCGSAFFATEDDGYSLIDIRMHGTRDEDQYVLDAAKRLIREKNAQTVTDIDGRVIAELSTGSGYGDD